MIKENLSCDSDLVETGYWPILITHSIPSMTEEKLTRQLEICGRLYVERQEPYVLVVDARTGRRPDAIERKILNDFRAEHQGHIHRFCRGIAFVFSSELLRGVLTAMYWVRKPSTETKVFTDYETALNWGAEQLGIPAPARRISQSA